MKTEQITISNEASRTPTQQMAFILATNYAKGWKARDNVPSPLSAEDWAKSNWHAFYDEAKTAINAATSVQQQKIEELERELIDAKENCEVLSQESERRRLAALDAFHVKQERDQLRTENAELRRQVEELGGAVLMAALGQRLVGRVVSAADMSLPDATDVELSLVRIIEERDTLKAQLEQANVEIKRLSLK